MNHYISKKLDGKMLTNLLYKFFENLIQEDIVDEEEKILKVIELFSWKNP